jgi:hypothetical protein
MNQEFAESVPFIPAVIAITKTKNSVCPVRIEINQRIISSSYLHESVSTLTNTVIKANRDRMMHKTPIIRVRTLT